MRVRALCLRVKLVQEERLHRRRHVRRDLVELPRLQRRGLRRSSGKGTNVVYVGLGFPMEACDKPAKGLGCGREGYSMRTLRVLTPFGA